MTVSAAVVGPAIIIFLPGVTPQQKEDASDSIEFSSRIAEGAHPGATGIGEWYKKYDSSLVNLHWIVQKVSNEVTSTDKSVANLLEVTVKDRQTIETVLKALSSKGENQAALNTFNDRSLTDVNTAKTSLLLGGGDINGKFQIVLCSSSNGALSAHFSCFQVCGKGSFSNGIFPEAGGKITLSMKQTIYSLNSELYAVNRDAIKNKLAGAGASIQHKLAL